MSHTALWRSTGWSSSHSTWVWTADSGRRRMARLRRCPNCGGGLAEDSLLCEFCSAALAWSQKDERLDVVSVVCPTCGTESPPVEEVCGGCGKPLVRMCPRCRAEIPRRAEGACPRCGLPAEAFYEQTVQEPELKEHALVRA